MYKEIAVGMAMILTGRIYADGLTPPHMHASRLANPPKIDGVIDPDEWKGASHVIGFTDPVTGNLTKDPTEAWVGYDKSAIYVAFYCHDSKPEGIVGREIHPGSSFNGEDTVRIRLNPFGSRSWEGRSSFTVNVLGTQNDDIAGGHVAKREWRGEWQSAAKRLVDGWSVEIRIPWKVLKYPSRKLASMDLNLERFQPRTQVFSQWANTTVTGLPERIGFWDDVEPPPQDKAKALQFLAYTAPEYDDGSTTVRSGLDVRYAVTPTLTALASINPDFKNIESQIAGVEFTRTERFLNDPRPFFTEGNGFFGLMPDFGIGSTFYSNRITNFDYGLKTYGQVTPNTSIGVLSTVSSGKEEATVARVLQTFGPKANVSAYAVHDDQPGQSQDTFGLNGWTRRGSFSAEGQLAASGVEGQKGTTASSALVAYEAAGWFSSFRYEWVPPEYNPPLSYIPWVDRKGFYNYTEYYKNYRHGAIKSLDINAYSTSFLTYRGDLQQHGTDYFANFNTFNDMSFDFGQTQTQYADGPDSVTGVGVTFNQSNRFKRFHIYYESGKRSSATSNFLAVDVSRRLFKKLDVGLNYAALRFDGTDAQTILTVGSELNKKESVTGRYVQHNGSQNYYLAYRNSGLSGTEWYFILGDPNSTTGSFQRRISVKVVWAF